MIAAKLAGKVRFLLGLFCFEAFDCSAISMLGNAIGQPSWRMEKLNAADGQMTVTLRDQSVHRLPLSIFDDYIKPGCTGCADFTAKRSDISLGGVGSAPGMSSAIVRTAEGLGLFRIAEEMGYIESWDGLKLNAIENVGKIKLKKHSEKSRPCH